MRTLQMFTGLAVCAAIAAGCGEDEAAMQPAKATITPAERQAQLEQDPYDLRCADLRDKVDSARMTRIVQYALADDAKIPASTACAPRRASSTPSPRSARTSRGRSGPPGRRSRGVRSGEYLADLGTP